MDHACGPLSALQWRVCREEAATAKRDRLRVSPHSTRLDPVWQLTVIGKRGRERTVPVSPATVVALRAHWRDRGLSFDELQQSAPLLSPLVVPHFRAAETRHSGETANGYTTHGLWKLVRR